MVGMKKMIRTYSELILIPTFKERFTYLKLNGVVGEETFGHDRYINQMLYKSDEWLSCRTDIIVRDNGCDLGLENYEIFGKILIHHITPITLDDILHRRDIVFDPENLISTSLRTHNAIHYGDESLLYSDPVERKPNDTSPWLL